MDRQNPNFVSADRPLTDPSHDRLGYAVFAENLAKNICSMMPSEGLVIAIYGAWGSGKTSLLNFICHYLERPSAKAQPVVVRFNPWWFSGREDLIRRYFEQLQAVLGKRAWAKELMDNIAGFSEAVSETGMPYSGLLKTLTWTFRLLGRERDVVEAKRRLEDELKKHNDKIVVVIDDIDRLSTDEIGQLFSLVKSVADFPNIIYLLAFDKVVVGKALETQCSSGAEYLDKVVQVPLELPLPDRTSLRALFFEKLDRMLMDTPDELFNQTYWQNVYLESIDHFIQTPRHVVRLANALEVTYPALRGEVNAVDFIALETLRVFSPVVYESIRRNPDMFLGEGTSEDPKSFHDSWLSQVPEVHRRSLRALLLRTFPYLQAVWHNTSYGQSYQHRWRRERRVCSPDVFQAYFRLAVPMGDITHTEMKALLEVAASREAFTAKLRDLAGQKRPDGRTRLSASLDTLENYTSEIPSKSIHPLIETLFDVGDELLRPEDEGGGFLDWGNDVRIGRVLWQLLQRLDRATRFGVLKTSVEHARSISTVVREIEVLGQQHGKYGSKDAEPESQRLIDASQLQELEQIALRKVWEAVSERRLIDAPKLSAILYFWLDMASDEARHWVHSVTSDDYGLARVLEEFLSEVRFWSGSDVAAQTKYNFKLEELKRFIEPLSLIERARLLTEDSNLTEKQRRAAELFCVEYDKDNSEVGGDA